MSTIPTQDQLEENWGIERFVEAMRVLSVWMQNTPPQVTKEQLEDLGEQSKDALELLKSRLHHKFTP